MAFRSIDAIKNVIESSGLSISYLFDDLIFVKHNAYLLRFDDTKDGHFYLHFNFDSDTKERDKIEHYLKALGQNYGVSISTSQLFKVVPHENESFDVHFLEN